MDNFRFNQVLPLAIQIKSPKWDKGPSQRGKNQETEEIQNVTCLEQFLKRNVYIVRGINLCVSFFKILQNGGT